MQICLLHLQRGYFVWFLGRKNPKTNPTHTHTLVGFNVRKDYFTAMIKDVLTKSI